MINYKLLRILVLIICCISNVSVAFAQSSYYSDEMKGLLFVSVTGSLIIVGEQYSYFLQLDYAVRDALGYSDNIPLQLNFNGMKLNRFNSVAGRMSVKIVNPLASNQFRNALFESGFREFSHGEFWKSADFTGQRVLGGEELPIVPVKAGQQVHVYSYGEVNPVNRSLGTDQFSVTLGGTAIFPLMSVQKLNLIE